MRVVIIGGGVMGSSLAYWLVRDPAFSGEVTVVERDPTYARASSALSASGIRQQFSTAINVAVGRFGIEFLRDLAAGREADEPDLGLVEGGYLYLATPTGRPVLEANHALQRAGGAEVALLEPPELRARYPWLALDDLALGSLGLAGEGWFDGWALLQILKGRARRGGARYLTGEAVAARGREVRLAGGEVLPFDVAVDAAGPWAGEVGRLFDVEVPVEPRRRTVVVFDTPDPPRPCPLVIDPSGVWFRPEGGGFITGAPPLEADLPDLPLDPEADLFEARIWPALAQRVPAFERLRPRNSWAGYYEVNTFDRNGLVGPHPDRPELLLMNGFSGHGIQQAPAAGRALAELITHGRYTTLDLTPLDPSRVPRGEPLLERNVI